jgi:TetR/AcrR family tetracycline transcriptional repressor
MGTKAGLTTEAVLDAAVELVETDGIAALSMRRLATTLGVEAMSLYNHVKDKDALLDGIAQTVIARLEYPALTGTDWRSDLRELARAYRRLAHRYPHTFALATSRRLTSLAGLPPVEAALSVTYSAGYTGARAVRALRASLAYLTGALLREVGATTALGGRLVDGYSDRVASLPEGAFPLVREVAEHLDFCDHDVEFEFGLDLLVAALGVSASDHATPGTGGPNR